MKSLDARVTSLERLRGARGAVGVCTFADGSKRELSFPEVARACFDGNRAGIVGIEWTTPPTIAMSCASMLIAHENDTKNKMEVFNNDTD